MQKKRTTKHIIITLMVFLAINVMMINNIYGKIISNVGEDALKFTDLDENPNIGYSVGLMYYDVWRYNNGNWTSDGKPDETHADKHLYKLEFAKERKVKSTKVYTFNPNNPKHMSIWNDVRGIDYVEEYEEKVGKNIQVTKSTPTGIGTNKINIDVRANVTLTANKPEVLPPKPYQGQNVMGLRYYIPIVIEIEFEGGNNLGFKGVHGEGSGAEPDADYSIYNGHVFTKKWGPYDMYTEIYVYHINNWIKLVGMTEKEILKQVPTEIIKLKAGETVSKDYIFNGQFSGYDKRTHGLAYALFQGSSKNISPKVATYEDIFEEFKQAD